MGKRGRSELVLSDVTSASYLFFKLLIDTSRLIAGTVSHGAVMWKRHGLKCLCVILSEYSRANAVVCVRAGVCACTFLMIFDFALFICLSVSPFVCFSLSLSLFLLLGLPPSFLSLSSVPFLDPFLPLLFCLQ